MTQSSDRNVLLGILALQNDLVTRDQFIEAINAWAEAKDRRLGEILVERGALNPECLHLLKQLLDVAMICPRQQLSRYLRIFQS